MGMLAYRDLPQQRRWCPRHPGFHETLPACVMVRGIGRGSEGWCEYNIQPAGFGQYTLDSLLLIATCRAPQSHISTLPSHAAACATLCTGAMCSSHGRMMDSAAESGA